MGQEACNQNYELAFIKGFEDKLHELTGGSATVKAACFTPPLLPGKQRAWADYTPGPNENYNTTSRVSEVVTKLEYSMREKAWPWLQERADEKALGVVVGVSNGGLPAAGTALYFKKQLVPVLFFLSSVPTPEQQTQLKDYYTGSTLCTVGSQEPYWPKEIYKFASMVKGDVQTFDGHHAGESKTFMQRLGRLAAKRLIASSGVMTSALPSRKG